jgi:4-diphosphocytidyl-2-C-methyl-D-erythritol kinase
MILTERAPAKINLTLRVLGRRPDGYHELESLVAFAELADEVSLDTDAPFGVATSGPFAGGIAGGNLVEKACQEVEAASPGVRLGSFHLVKRIPVAAGLGGGSADAAATLRLLARANPGLESRVDLAAIARRLGADVPVCLAGKPAIMHGIGERIEQVGPLLPLHLLLVNPRVPLATAEVFRALSAPELTAMSSADAATVRASSYSGRAIDLAELLSFMRAVGNDLGLPAERLCPVIADVRAALAALPGCLYAAQSGSGPTCFGVFEDVGASERAQSQLSAAQPAWWCAATAIV